MIQTKAVPPGTPPKDAVTVSENVEFADYLKAVEAARKAHDHASRRCGSPAPAAARVQHRRPRLPRRPGEGLPARRPRAGRAIRRQSARRAGEGPAAQGSRWSRSPCRTSSTPRRRARCGSRARSRNSTRAPTLEVIAINDDENQGKTLTRFTVGVRHDRPGDQDPQPEHRRRPGSAPAAGFQDPIGLAAGPLGMGTGQPGPCRDRPRPANRARPRRQTRDDPRPRTGRGDGTDRRRSPRDEPRAGHWRRPGRDGARGRAGR